MTIRIDKIVLHNELDTNPDLSWIGRYSNEPGPADRTVDRAKMVDDELVAPRGEYRYFIAAMSGDETGNPDSVRQDYEQMEAINCGDISFYGIWAGAVVSYEVQPGNHRLERLQSSGLWGISSENASQIAEVEQEELAALKSHLSIFGVDIANFDELAAHAERKTS